MDNWTIGRKHGWFQMALLDIPCVFPSIVPLSLPCRKKSSFLTLNVNVAFFFLFILKFSTDGLWYVSVLEEPAGLPIWQVWQMPDEHVSSVWPVSSPEWLHGAFPLLHSLLESLTVVGCVTQLVHLGCPVFSFPESPGPTSSSPQVRWWKSQEWQLFQWWWETQNLFTAFELLFLKRKLVTVTAGLYMASKIQ